MYKTLPKVVRDAIDEKITWLKTYLVMAKEYNYSKEAVRDATRKLKKLEQFKRLKPDGRTPA